MSRRHLYSIAPDGDFLGILADRVLDGALLNGWPRDGAFWLSDVTIVLPTQRARLTLAERFAARLGGATLLPDIRTFGGEDAEEEPFLPPVDAPALPPAATLLERRLLLSAQVAAFAQTTIGRQGFASPPNAAEIIKLADSLSQLLDDLEIAGVTHRALRELVVGDLAANWQDTVKFLDIVLKAWPKILSERGKADAAVNRNERLKRQAKTAPLLYGERPVIAAGSTGSIPATARLLLALSRLGRGAIVLPGLDTSLSGEQHQALLDADANTHGHPQYGLAVLLRELGAGIGDVEELVPEPMPRTRLVRTALALADDTARWGAARAELGEAGIEDALRAVGIVAAPNADLEARAIALAARQGLVDKKSVGIVTPDQTLARRIAAELSRHGIGVDDPAGTPLYQSAAGRLARLALTLAVNRFAAVDLIGLLRNRSVVLGLARADVAQATDRLDRLLRGERPAPGIAGLRELLAARSEQLRAQDAALIGEVLDRLEMATAPICGVLTEPATQAGAFAAALAASVGALREGDDETLPGATEFERWAKELAGLEAVPGFAPVNLDGVLAALMQGVDVHSAVRRRDDIHIWGALEARLQSVGLMILAGVNEDIWPGTADPGPWLSRKMRVDIGLSPPERRQGQAAHDFEMALGNKEVLIACAERLGTSPALPSRLLQRLEAFAGKTAAEAMRARGARWVAAARALDRAPAVAAATMPRPTPPASVRPKRLSVTEIETLMRSPYDLYAKHVLKLRQLDPLGASVDARDRGSITHKVFSRFVEEHEVMDPDAPAILQRLATEEFSGLEAIGERRDIWLRRFALTAEEFLAYERAREPNVQKRHAEQKGEWKFPALGGFVLSGRADRLDLLKGGALEIIDFKTGTLPSVKEMRDFDAPQLLLEAAMAREGAFPALARAGTSALTYIKIGLGPQAFVVAPFKTRDGQSVSEAAEEAARRMQGHVAEFLLKDDSVMLPRIRPAVNRTYRGDYEHLARTDEWTLVSGGEE